MLVVFTWILFGALAGWVAALIARQSVTALFFWNLLFGAMGAVLGGVIYSSYYHLLVFDSGNLSAGIVGAIVMLALVNFIRET